MSKSKTKAHRTRKSNQFSKPKHSPFGNFSQLPYEVRELIWLELAPAGQDTPLERVPKTGLGILCANRALYKEISRLIYQRSALEFDVSPSYQAGEPWVTAHFTNRHLSRRERIEDKRTTWILQSYDDACSRGFGRLPFHKIREIIVKLYATDPQRDWGLYTLWKKTTELVRLLKRATVIQSLTIRLEKWDGSDWIDNELLNQSFGRYYDHDLVVLPFCTGRNVRTIEVEAHSNEVNNKIDWSAIDWATTVCHSEDGDSDDCADRDDLDYLVSKNYYWMHQELWNDVHGPIADMLRLELLRERYAQGSSGFSQFDRDMVWILYMHPDIPEELDPELLFLTDMQVALICMYHYAVQKRGKKVLGEPWDWDQEVWNCYPRGIPAASTSEYTERVECYVDEELYYDYLDHGAYLSIIPTAMQEWHDREG